MKTKPEITLRGPLAPGQANSLRRQLTRLGLRLRGGREEVLFFETAMFPLIGDFDSGFSRLSLKRDSGGLVLRLKGGAPSGAVRERLSLHLQADELPQLLLLLQALGLHSGYYRPAHREVFGLEGCLLSLKTHCVIGDHFELELPDRATLETTAFTRALDRLSVCLWTEEEYRAAIRRGMENAPAVPLQPCPFSEGSHRY